MSKLYSGALVLLLAFTAVWGQCAACPLILPEKANDCCNRHSGSCQMPTPKQSTERPCPDQALAPAVDQPAASQLPLAAAPVALVPAPEAAPLAVEPFPHDETPPDTGPPVLYLLNLVLLV